MPEERQRHQGGKEEGNALLELAIVLPVLVIILGIIIALGALLQQLFWFEQTSYNSALFSSSLPLFNTEEVRKKQVEDLALDLSSKHRTEQRFQFISFEPVADKGVNVDPFDIEAASETEQSRANPTLRYSGVELVGEVQKLFLETLAMNSRIKASSLVPLPVSTAIERFSGSDFLAPGYGAPGCCGTGGSNSTSCVDDKTYAYNCADEEAVGYFLAYE